MHYIHARRRGEITKTKCKVDDCSTNEYAKGYCYKHWYMSRINGEKLYKRHGCLAEGCGALVIKGDYCTFHQIRVNAGMHLEATRTELISGPNNVNWNGGKSYYTNHSEFKRQRIIKLRAVNYTCEECGDYTNKCHHRDGLKVDHRQENLQALCTRCHWKVHKGMSHTSKFRRIYGNTLSVIASHIGVSVATVSKYHKQGTLSSML